MIYQAVIASRNAKEHALINGGDDDATPEECPTRKDVLDAASVISKHLLHANHNDYLDSNAHKIESLLGALRHQLRLKEDRSKAPTLITSFFHCK
jgi:hypothetical protein